jgi:phosphopantetheinyl transferase
LKEAYTKRLGSGLTFGFNRITTDPQAAQPLRAIDGQSAIDPGYLSLCTACSNYYIALSVSGAVAEPQVQLLKAADFAF